MFKLGAKANIEIKCLTDRKDKGFSMFELYTGPETFEHDNREILDRVENWGPECFVVHAPHETGTRKNVNDCGVAGLNMQTNQKSTELILKSIDLAQILIKGKDKFVVVHPASQTFLEPKYQDVFLLDLPQRQQKIREARAESISNAIANLHRIIGYAKDKGVIICLENMPSLDMSFNGRYASYCSFANVEDFKKVLAQINSPNLMFTLDTCHLLSHIRTMRMILETNGDIGCNLPEDILYYKEDLQKEDHEIIIIEKFLEELKDKIGVIHLNNSIELGLTKHTHSTKFTDNDKSLLQRFFKKLKELSYKNAITLEVNEIDLTNASAQLETYNTIINLGAI